MPRQGVFGRRDMTLVGGIQDRTVETVSRRVHLFYITTEADCKDVSVKKPDIAEQKRRTLEQT